MKIFLVSVLCFALSEAHSLGGAAVSNQQSGINAGPGSTGIAHGVSTAEGGLNGAISNQKSIGIGGAGSTIVADGESHATSQGGQLGGINPLLAKYGLGGGGGGGGRFLGGAPSVSNQNSKVHVGEGGTGIANGVSTAQGVGDAISNQKSTAFGGPGATVVADGQSSATSFGKRNIDEDKGVYTAGGGVRVSKSIGQGHHGSPHEGGAVSNQESKITGGRGSTNIAHGTSDAQGGAGGALANQRSQVKGGAGSTNVADGSSSASTGFREARSRGHGNGATANQNSQANVYGPGNARANGVANANSRGGPASANQNSSANVLGPGSASANGRANANSFKKRATDTGSAEEGENTSDLISKAITGTVQDAANKIIKDPKTLVISSKVAAKNP